MGILADENDPATTWHIDDNTLTVLINAIDKKWDMHDSLIFYACRKPEDFEDPAIRPMIDKVVEQYPDGINKLEECESLYRHGFNNGACAAFEYVLGFLTNETATADERLVDAEEDYAYK